MGHLRYPWKVGSQLCGVDLIHIVGTHGEHFSFAEGEAKRSIQVRDFGIGRVSVTKALWEHVMGPGFNLALYHGENLPVDYVSWNEIHRPDGFFTRMKQSQIRAEMADCAREQGGH